MSIKGKRTYFVSIAMAILGLLLILFPPQATWSNPSGQVGLIIGTLMIGYAAGTASTRAAIYSLQEQLSEFTDTLKKL